MVVKITVCLFVCLICVLIFVKISLKYARMLIKRGRIDYRSVAKYCKGKLIKIGIGTGMIVAFIIILILNDFIL